MYVYQEYPKCLYQRDGSTVTASSEEEEMGLVKDGWMTAEQFHTGLPDDTDNEKPDDTENEKPDAKRKRK